MALRLLSRMTSCFWYLGCVPHASMATVKAAAASVYFCSLYSFFPFLSCSSSCGGEDGNELELCGSERGEVRGVCV